MCIHLLWLKNKNTFTAPEGFNPSLNTQLRHYISYGRYNLFYREILAESTQKKPCWYKSSEAFSLSFILHTCVCFKWNMPSTLTKDISLYHCGIASMFAVTHQTWTQSDLSLLRRTWHPWPKTWDRKLPTASMVTANTKHSIQAIDT